MKKGEIIKELREQRKMTQEQLADKLGTSKQTIFKYENDIITNIPSDKVELLAEIFKVSPAYIMGWNEPEENNNFIINLDLLDGKRREFAENIKSIYLSGVADDETFEVISKIIMNDWEFLQALKNK